MIFLENKDVISSQTSKQQTTTLLDTTTQKTLSETTTLDLTTMIPLDENKINGKKPYLLPK